MHELSLARNIIEFAEEFAAKHQIKKITRIELEIGLLSGIVKESLKFALEFGVKQTILDKADIVITQIPGKATCNECRTVFEIYGWNAVCPDCRSVNFEITDVKEMQIKSIYTD